MSDPGGLLMLLFSIAIVVWVVILLVISLEAFKRWVVRRWNR